jgi:hypothetical protein
MNLFALEMKKSKPAERNWVTDATIEFVAESGNSTALIGFHRAVSS